MPSVGYVLQPEVMLSPATFKLGQTGIWQHEAGMPNEDLTREDLWSDPQSPS